MNNKGIRVMGGKLPKRTSQNSQRLDYTNCFDKKDTTYTFAILDDFKDGVCCDWGDGSFTVEWDGEQVLNSYDDQFKTSKTLCLSLEANLIALEIEIKNFQRDMSFQLWDREGNRFLTERGYGDKGEQIFVSQCIPRDKCLRFGIVNINSETVSLKITMNSTTLYEQVGIKLFEKGESGNCDMNSCPENQFLLKLDVATDRNPNDFSWALLDIDGKMLVDVDKYKIANSYHYFGTCIFKESCLSVGLLDLKGDAGTWYEISLDKTTIQELRKAKGFFEEIKLNNCSNMCAENETLFQLDIITDDHPNELSWELVDRNNDILASGDKYADEFKYYAHKQCILNTNLTVCQTLRLIDGGENGGMAYRVSWNKTTIAEKFQDKALVEKVDIGDCSDDLCSTNEILFELGLFTAKNPDEFSWKLMDSNNLILASHSQYNDRYKYFNKQQCISRTNFTRCPILQLSDTGNHGGTKYNFTWEGEIIGSGNQINTSQLMERYCCGKNKFAFSLGFSTDEYPQDFSWNLMDSMNNISTEGSGYAGVKAQYDIEECI